MIRTGKSWMEIEVSWLLVYLTDTVMGTAVALSIVFLIIGLYATNEVRKVKCSH